jgi:hypothetical protein
MRWDRSQFCLKCSMISKIFLLEHKITSHNILILCKNILVYFLGLVSILHSYDYDFHPNFPIYLGLRGDLYL